LKKKFDILGIIPARGGSRGIPHKNIKQLAGRPLIYYAIKLAQRAKRRGVITDYLISTDDKRIRAIAKRYGGVIPFLRPKQLATDKSPVIDTVIHAVKWWEQEHKRKVHSILLLQPTNPLTGIEDLIKAVKVYLINQPAAKSLISVCDAQHVRLPTLYYTKGRYLRQVVKNINPVKPRQNLKKIYWRNGSIYITRRDLLFKKRAMLDKNPFFCEISRFHSVAIDDMFDWILAEFLLQYDKKQK
jgi:CMP-N-acetylneuraminic acid synthetase